MESTVSEVGTSSAVRRERGTLLSRRRLHPYQRDAVAFFCAAPERQLVAPMGSGKTIIALTAIVDLLTTSALTPPILIIAPLMIAGSVWTTEAAAWEHTAHLQVVRVIGTAKQRTAALDGDADIYVCNFDNSAWLAVEIARRGMRFGLLLIDEASALKNPLAQRTRTCITLGAQVERRWTITGTPRAYQLLDVWGPAQFCTNGRAFAPFYRWRNTQFFSNDLYQRIWHPHAGVEDQVINTLRSFTKVVDRAALNTRPPVVEIVHDIELDPLSAGVYQQLDSGGITDAVTARLAQGLLPSSEMAIVGKLMQVLSGAVYDDAGGWRHLHDLRLDALAEIHAAHCHPTLVYFNFRHEAERIRQRFPFAAELRPELIDPWNTGRIEMLIAHPASAGHGINLQHGSDTLVWFSLPWSAELFQQANARLARQGQTSTVNIHILISAGMIDEIALRVVRNRLRAQDALIEALQTA
jgi:SNF2 family DNA or RNA helicase